FVPCSPDKSAFPPCHLIGAAGVFMLNDGCPCFYRVVFFCHGFPPQSEQGTSYIWKPYAVRAIGIPGETCPPRAPPGFIFRHPGTSGRIVGLLRFPGDDTVFDMHLPAA